MYIHIHIYIYIYIYIYSFVLCICMYYVVVCTFCAHHSVTNGVKVHILGILLLDMHVCIVVINVDVKLML